MPTLIREPLPLRRTPEYVVLWLLLPTLNRGTAVAVRIRSREAAVALQPAERGTRQTALPMP